MDRANDTSEPTTVPTTVPPQRQNAPARVAFDAPAATESQPSPASAVMMTGSPPPDVALTSARDAVPPRPLPARAFSFQSYEPPDSPRQSQLVNGFAFREADRTTAADPAALSGGRSSIAAMIAPLERLERSVSPPADIDPVFAEIDAEASRRALAAASAITKAPHKPPVEPQLSPSAMAAGASAPAPTFFPQEVTALVADSWARPSLSTAEADPRARRSYTALLKRGGKIVGMIAVGWLAVVLLLIVAYRYIDPPVSALMLQQLAVGQEIEHQWVPIDEISPNVIRAVLVSEDGRFCEHNGIDYEAIQAAIERAGRGSMRGASTISMQVIKNLFLWPSKSYLRKAIELPLTYVMELVWSKRRIMEVYLNIAEWGPGIFGIESAARYHFNKSARRLSEREAARLAVALPNPLIRDAGEPGPGMQRLANSVQVRMRLAPSGQLACVLGKRSI